MRTSNLWPSFALVALITCAFLAWRAGAQSAPSAPTPPTVAMVNLEKVINNLEELATRNAEVTALREELQKGVDAKGAELSKMGDSLKILQPNSPEHKKTQQEALRKRVEIEVDGKIAEQLLDQKKAEVHRGLFIKIQDAVNRLAKQRGYALVLSHDGEIDIIEGQEGQVTRQIAMRRILYADKSLDVSDELLGMMNNEWRTGAKR